MNQHKNIYNNYLDGKNILITGPGGTGKSFAIKKIYNHAKEYGKKICVTAMTGVASVLLDCNATTVHTWSGIGLGNRPDNTIINKILKSKFYKYNWVNTDILIVDEISMMSLKIFDLLNKIGQEVRNNKKPFGGIQIIFSGDFFQLPPVRENNFCFESENFNNSFHITFNLTKVFRQKDPKYKKILLNLRKGLISTKTIELLNSKVLKKDSDINNSTDITRLVPTKSKANSINDHFINKIKDKKFIYKRTYKESSNGLNEEEKTKLGLMTEQEKDNEYNFIKDSTLTEEQLILKKGSYVMCIANLNLECGIANGTTGKVVDFNESKFPIVQFGENKVVVGKKEWKSDNIPGISLFQIPLILAWGITIHKAQGLTLEKAIIDIGKDLFEAGQMYVALSRLKSLDELYLQEFCLDNLKINVKVLDYYKKLESDNSLC